MSLVERVVKGQIFVVPAYARTFMVRKEFRRSWLNKKKYDERTLQLSRQVFFAYSGPVIVTRSSLNSS
jgi:hypothetical protein